MDVNIKQLAQELNLSIATVSRALRDSHEVNPETKKRVLELAQKLNYQPNPFASSLRAQKSNTIAVVIPDVDNNFFALAIKGIEDVAQEMGYHVLVYLTHENLEKEIEITRLLHGGRVDGILMSVSSETAHTEHLNELLEKNIPIVFFDRVCETLEPPKVTTDDYESGFKATEHLIESGCRRIAFLQISNDLSIGRKRFKGYTDALEKHHLPFTEDLVVLGTKDEALNYKTIKDLLTSSNVPDGVFASVESLAITTYYVCNEIGLSIPNQVKIISFSNLTTAALLAPSLTTITQPAYEIGKESASILFRLFKKNNFPYKKNVVLSSTLIIRNSTNPSLIKQ